MTKVELINIGSDEPKHFINGVIIDGLFVDIPMKEVTLASGFENNVPTRFSEVPATETTGGGEEIDSQYLLSLNPDGVILDPTTNSAVTISTDLRNINTGRPLVADSYTWYLDGVEMENSDVANITINKDMVNQTKLISTVEVEITIDGETINQYTTIQFDKSDMDQLETRDDDDNTPDDGDNDGDPSGGNDNDVDTDDSDPDTSVGDDPDRQIEVPDRV